MFFYDYDEIKLICTRSLAVIYLSHEFVDQ